MIEPLPVDQLRWRFDASKLSFETTSDLAPIAGVVGQSTALEALSFGLETRAPGQNIFIRGVSGTGRMSTVRRLLDELQPVCRVKQDRVYVHNFATPERPRLITLAAGKARMFRRSMRRFAEFIAKDLERTMESESLISRRQAIENATKSEIAKATKPLEEELEAAGFVLVTQQTESASQNMIFPVHEEEPIAPEQFELLHQQNEVPKERYEQVERDLPKFNEKLRLLSRTVSDSYRAGVERMRDLMQSTARQVIEEQTRPILDEYGSDSSVQVFLNEIVEDLVEQRLTPEGEPFDPFHLFGVNIVLTHAPGDACPIVIENHPAIGNLLGAVDPEWRPTGEVTSDYQRIRAGSLLRADGGYLILDTRDILSEPSAWKVLKRTLRNGSLEIVPPEITGPFAATALKPDPIPIQVRVVLVGDSQTYALLDGYDPDFNDLFKVLADFDAYIEADTKSVEQYAGVIARLASEESLLPFDPTAIGRLAEHGCRIAAHRRRLTTRFGRVSDLAREASFLAEKHGRSVVTHDEVDNAIRRNKTRGGLPSRRFQDLLQAGTIQVDTVNSVVGQINGLAVMSAGPLTYGFPARITATIGAGHAGIIDIEGSSSMSGSIHTKGFHILGGLLRTLLKTDHPLTFSASLAFEQSYGGIDGDSASGAETICLLSALMDIPIRQDLAITGAIDQLGHLQAIGGVNEKIEGFFDICAARSLTGSQGVVIPRSNQEDLQLRSDVVDACRDGRFHIYSVEWIHDAIELFTGQTAGRPDTSGNYPDGSVLSRARNKAREYWERTAKPSHSERAAAELAEPERPDSETT